VYWTAFESACADRQLTIDLAESYNEVGANRGALEVESALAALVGTELHKEFASAVRAGLPLDAERVDLARKFIAAASQLQKAKHLITRGRREALAEMRSRMLELLKPKPAVLRDVLAAIDAMEQEDASA
jgi:hypothetical protein